jgi:hypothetical protein
MTCVLLHAWGAGAQVGLGQKLHSTLHDFESPQLGLG